MATTRPSSAPVSTREASARAPAFGFVGVNALRTPNGGMLVGQVAHLIQIVCRDGNRHDPLNADAKGIIQRFGQCLRV
jgi:hypothetical protein